MKTIFTIMTQIGFSRNPHATRVSTRCDLPNASSEQMRGSEGRECCVGVVSSSARGPVAGARRRPNGLLGLLAFVMLVSAGLPAAAAPPAQEGDSMGSVTTPAASALQEVDQRLRIVERRVEIGEDKREEEAKRAPSATASGKGFFFHSPDKSFQVRIRGLLQADSRSYFQDSPAPDTLLLRRVRPYVDATLFGAIDVRIMPDFADGKAVLFDAYADLHPFKTDALRLRIGKFKTPIGLERLQSASNITFVERSYVTSLVPNRDVGISLYGNVGRGTLEWAVGIFNGVVDGGNGDVDGTDSKEIAGRVFLHPLAFFDRSTESGENVGPLTSYRKAFGIGVGASYGRPRGAIATSGATTNLPSFKSPGQQTAFSYLTDTPATAGGTVLANGSHYRISPQFYTYLGSLGVIGELVYAPQAVIKGGQTANLENTAWQVAASYVLTGEDASYDGIKPLAPVSWSDGHWGAWEIGLRYHELRLDGGAFPVFADTARSVRKAQSFGGVLNWYLTNQLRFALDFEYSTFEWGGRQGRDRENEKVLFSRLQVNF